MRAWNLLDQTVRAEHGEFSAHPGRFAPTDKGIFRFTVQTFPHVTIAKAADQELTSADRLKSLDLLWIKRSQASMTPTVDFDSFMMRCQLAGFRVPDWNLRMAIYEPGLYREFRFPTYAGQGQKMSLHVRWKAGKRWVLEGRYALLSYHDRKSMGSGYEQSMGSKRHETGIQLRVSL